MHQKNKQLEDQQQNIMKNIQKQLNMNIIQLNNNQYHLKNWSKIFSSISKLNCSYLFINNNQSQTIRIRDISYIQFINLKSLYLNNDHIQTIESLGHILAPSLEELSLMNNNITNIKSIKKVVFPNLKFINICNNPIIDPTPLLSLVSKNMKYYHLQRWLNHPVIGQNIAWTAKAEYFEEITLKSNKRRNKGKVCEQINKKSKNIKFQ